MDIYDVYDIKFIDDVEMDNQREETGIGQEIKICSRVLGASRWHIGKYFSRLALSMLFIAAILSSFSIGAFAEQSHTGIDLSGGIIIAAAPLPTAPTDLKAIMTDSSGVELSWTDRSDNENTFIIEKTIDSGNVTEIPLGANTTTYTDINISAGHTYIYRVYAKNDTGRSSYSNEAVIYELDTVSPASLTVTPVTESRLNLSWSYSGTGSYKTIIERKDGISGKWSVIYTTAQGVLSYSDTGLSANTQYFYRIRKSLGTNAYSAAYPNSIVGIGAYTRLGMPYLSGYAASNNSIYLLWSGNSAGADMVIERRISTGEFTALTTLSSSASGWQDDTGLVPGASYTYRIKGKTSSNESAYSNEVTIRNQFLETPMGLSATVNKDFSVELKWTDNSDYEEGFEIWRYESDSGQTYKLYATVGRNATSYIDTNVHKGSRYNYMVRAFVPLSGLYSAYSNSAAAGIGIVAPPTDLKYTYVSSSKITLEWTDNSDNESGFKIEWKKGDEGEWRVLTWVSSNVKAYTISDLNKHTRYFFRVRAYSYVDNADALSDELLVSTSLPFAPTELSAASFSSSTVKLKWKDNSDDENGFIIMRKTQFSDSYTEIAKVDANTTEYTDTRIRDDIALSYKVAAYNAAGMAESASVATRTIKKVGFSDLGSVSWAKEAIENLAGMDVVKGATGTLYMPNNTISKAEFTVMIVRAFGLDIVPVGSLADVRSDKWYYRQIMIAENLGIIFVDSSKRFYPEAAIKREEIAVMLFKALEASGKTFTVHDNTTLEIFYDKNKISPNATASMATLVGEGIIDGLSEHSIAPGATATRAQAAVLLYRALQKF